MTFQKAGGTLFPCFCKAVKGVGPVKEECCMDVGIRTYGNAAFCQPYAPDFCGKTEKGFLEEVTKVTPSGGPSAYDRLTPSARKTVEKLKEGRGLTKTQWTDLCRELKDMGVITQAEFDYTRGDLHLVPVISDSRGGVTALGMKERLNSLYQASQVPGGLEAWSSDTWAGDPLEYLDEWLESLRKWKGELSAERWPDGGRKYQDFSAVDVQVDACQKVMDVLRGLMAHGNA